MVTIKTQLVQPGSGRRSIVQHPPNGLLPIANISQSRGPCLCAQVQLYQAALAAGITLLSIGHRPALRNFHSVAVHFDGHQVRSSAS